MRHDKTAIGLGQLETKKIRRPVRVSSPQKGLTHVLEINGIPIDKSGRIEPVDKHLTTEILIRIGCWISVFDKILLSSFG